MRPRFSVVIAVRNEAEIVGRCLASVLAQTCADLEVVVVDTGSSDPTVAVVRSIADRRVRIVGPADHPLAHALHVARGGFVTVLEAEDEADPGWLARLGRLADATGAGIVSCGGEHHHRDGSVTTVQPTTDPATGLATSLRPGAIAVRRDLLPADQDPAASFAQRCTSAIASACAAEIPVVATPEPLVRWNERHDDTRLEGDALVLQCSQQAIDALARSPIPDPGRLAHYATVAGIAAVRSGEHRRARRLLGVARSAQPQVAKHWARWMVACVPPLATMVWAAESDGAVHAGPEPLDGGTTEKGSGVAAAAR